MSEFEKISMELELKKFTIRNFERPSNCRDAAQIRFYVRELCLKIEEYERRFNYVPQLAYSLLSQYTTVQNSMLHVEFVKSYA